MVPVLLVLAGLLTAIGCDGGERMAGFTADVTVNGETDRLEARCTLAPIQDVSGARGYGIEASDRESASGIYGVSLLWSSAEVTGPGEHDFSPLGVAAFVIRPRAGGSGLTSSSAGEGQVRFDDYDPDTRVGGVITGLRMERDDPDDMIVVEIGEATFLCDR